MDIFGVLTLIGGLALFLYGMNVMSDGLAKISGGKMEQILENLTSNPIKAVLLGAGVTAVIQSSSAKTRMVGRFVNHQDRFCKLRNYEAFSGSGRDHGRQHWYHSDFLDLKPFRY